MRALHVSDSHGSFIKYPGEYDIIIHSGDLLPNSPERLKKSEHLYQRDWVRDNTENFKQWIGNKPFLFCAGNHDYAEPCNELRDMGIDAIDITNKLVEINGYKIYGFPWVPYIGLWNFEAHDKKMQIKVDELMDVIEENKIDILVAHCPPYKCKDLNSQGVNIGNLHMLNAIKELKHLPKFYLTGHCHAKQSRGILDFPVNGKYIKIVNSATDHHILSI